MSCANDYEQFFDPLGYLNTFYTNPEYVVFGYKQLDKFWTQRKGNDLRVLEYGSGPVISRLVSACPHVKDFVLADYLEVNRKAVQAWIDKDPKTFDWRSNIALIVRELEGKGPDEVAKREGELRQKIKAIVPCDLKAENILDVPDGLKEKYGPPYDVIGSSFCIEDVVESEQEYKTVLAKFVKFLKPGGYLLMHGTLEETHYTTGSDNWFYNFYLTKDLVEESMKEAGFKEVQIDLASSYGPIQANVDGVTDAKDLFFVLGHV